MHKLVYTTLAGSLLAASSAVAGDFSTPIEKAPCAGAKGDLTVGYNSEYIWRGVNLGSDQVTAELGLQHTCPLTGQALDFTAWYGSSSRTPGAVSTDELDLSLSTSKDLGFATAEVGYIFYHFFNNQDDAQEVFAGLSRDFYGVNASLRYFWDIEGDNDGYSELALTKSVNVFGHAINLGATVGYLVEEGAFSHATGKASYDIAFGKGTLSPYIAYSVELDDLERFAAGTGAGQENEFFAGAAFTVKF